MAQGAKLTLLALATATAGIYASILYAYNGDRQAMLEALQGVSQRLGRWAMPVFVLAHTLAIATCFPYAVLFEAAASFLFGFVHGVACVFSAKVLGAALAFWLGRLLFRSSETLSGFVRKNKYFSVIRDGVARDGWKFVLLARFSPVPSYVINYGLAATNVGFFVDFLLPTLVGGLPMILQNTSIGSLTSAAAHSKGNSGSMLSYALPAIGVCSGILITWRIKRYASQGFEAQPRRENRPLEMENPRVPEELLRDTTNGNIGVLKRSIQKR
ncbi:uncharacterized protein LOC9655409 [Selaginella moellendorffii]|uniref:uncharacterized protein LOC9655409 n=1 Tax=Selaginella moellendorffii TaxID=88036 RepID=UPI000D1C3138|nr:uncharacterized protein LOC9655409 [Selaginella moellendorffii]|eukprot:XP_002965825.2 uncharacterized protein LOC9655409 [Selaginella moellendorffii]